MMVRAQITINEADSIFCICETNNGTGFEGRTWPDAVTKLTFALSANASVGKGFRSNARGFIRGGKRPLATRLRLESLQAA